MSLVIGYVALVFIVAGLPVGLWARLPSRSRRHNDRYLARLVRTGSHPMAEDRSPDYCHSHGTRHDKPTPEQQKPPEPAKPHPWAEPK